jgi:hypothetical protein
MVVVPLKRRLQRAVKVDQRLVASYRDLSAYPFPAVQLSAEYVYLLGHDAPLARGALTLRGAHDGSAAARDALTVVASLLAPE